MAQKRKAVCQKYGLHREMVDPQFRDPFIVTGYRQPNMKATDCIKSAFVCYCNETTNVWTHFLPFLIFLVQFVITFTQELEIEDSFTWPLISQAFGILGFCLMSSIAHTFNSLSSYSRALCFFLDYAAISIFSVGVGQAFYFYCRPLDRGSDIFQSPICFALISVFTSTTSTVICCLTWKSSHSPKHGLRTCAMVLPFLVNTSPYLIRAVICQTDLDCDYRALPLFVKHTVIYILAGIVNASKFPERFIPGVFDAFGQSHNLMHVFTALGSGFQFEAVKLDMINREHVLRESFIQSQSFYTAFTMAAAIVINFSIAIWFCASFTQTTYEKAKKEE